MATTTTKPNTSELDALRRENEELRAELAKRPAQPLALPFKPHPAAYVERILTVERMTVFFGPAEARKITALAAGLEHAREKLADGKPVYLPSHAVRWMLEHIDLVG